jgi:LysM repeat protein
MHRTYARRRLVACAIGLAVLGWGVPAAAGSLTSDAAPVGAAASYVVRPGDTLWDIAEQVAPGEDPRVVIAQIQRANALDGESLQPGRSLVLPVA